MPIAVVCPACKAKLKAPDSLLGKTVKCPGCAKPVLVKAATPAPAPAAKKPVKQPVKPPEPDVLDDEPVEEVPPAEDEVVARPRKKPRRDDETDGEEEAAGAPPGGPSTAKERGTAMWIHLLPLVLGCCGGIGTFISLFLWISKRKESPFIDHHGKTWLNFVINLFVVFFLLALLSGVLSFVAGLISSTVGTIVSGLFGLIMFALTIYVLVMYVVLGLKAKKGEWAEYRVLFKVLK